MHEILEKNKGGSSSNFLVYVTHIFWSCLSIFFGYIYLIK